MASARTGGYPFCSARARRRLRTWLTIFSSAYANSPVAGSTNMTPMSPRLADSRITISLHARQNQAAPLIALRGT